MNGLVMLALIAGLALWVAVTCFRLVVQGRVGRAWSVPLGLLLVAVAIAAVVTVIDTYGQAGLAVFLVLMFFFLPLLAGGVLGCLAGHLARAFRPAAPGAGER